MSGPAPLTLEQVIRRFRQRVKRGPGCWPWQGARNPRTGYGLLHARGLSEQPIAAHRFAFELATGRVPVEDVLHTCDNPPCCRPDHLYEGTAKDNAADSIARGRWKIGGNYRRFLSGTSSGGDHSRTRRTS